MLHFNQISISKFAGLIILAVLIFVVHRSINLLINKWVKKEAQESLLSVYVPITINFVWIFFILYCIYLLAIINPLVSVFISSLVLLATWNYVKDFVQGTIFKVQKGNLVGQLINVNDFSGKVVKMKNTRIYLQIENGKIIEYPYSKLSDTIIAISSNVEDCKKCTLNISVPITKEIEEIKGQLRLQLFNIPWIVTNREIKIDIISQDLETINFKISTYTLDEKFIPKIQQSIDFIKFD